AKTIDQLPVIRALRESTATNHRELSFAAKLDRFCKAAQPRMTFIFNCSTGLCSFRVRDAAVRVAEFHMVRRSLKCLADRVVIGNDEGGWLMSVHQQQRKARGGRESVLHLRPRGR